MSDVMLHGVLNMPPDIWCDTMLDKAQRHARYVEASQRIEAQEAELASLRSRCAELETALRQACDGCGHPECQCCDRHAKVARAALAGSAPTPQPAERTCEPIQVGGPAYCNRCMRHYDSSTTECPWCQMLPAPQQKEPTK